MSFLSYFLCFIFSTVHNDLDRAYKKMPSFSIGFLKSQAFLFKRLITSWGFFFFFWSGGQVNMMFAIITDAQFIAGEIFIDCL